MIFSFFTRGAANENFCPALPQISDRMIDRELFLYMRWHSTFSGDLNREIEKT